MRIAPQLFAQLRRSDNLTGIPNQQLQRSHFFRRQMKQGIPAPKRSIGFKPEAGEAKPLAG